MVKLVYQELESSLNPILDEKSKQRFMIAYRSLSYQDDYCRYHYKQFHKEYNLYVSTFNNEMELTDNINLHIARISFEANIFAFFRSLHALIESVPYLINILLEIEEIECNRLNWWTVRVGCENKGYVECAETIKSFRKSTSYKELEHIVNISKHRRIPRIDSGCLMNSESPVPLLMKEDLDIDFRSYDIKLIMENIFDDLHPKILKIIQLLIVSRKTGKRS